MKYVTVVGERSYVVDVEREGEIVQDGVTHQLDIKAIDQEGLYSLLVDNKSYEALVEESDEQLRVLINGTLYTVRVIDERAKRLAEAAGAFAPTAGDQGIKSPMPGLIVAVAVNEGDAVKKGQVVIVLESMKMENELKSPRDGIVSSIKVSLRQAVEQGQVLLTIGDK
ncbi:MAG TPA: acetyl-CoA carboxylase biotin carboxyl carrier protein subunit [Anaerolineae bacterium]|jgi:biotin carboxyl carrier protein